MTVDIGSARGRIEIDTVGVQKSLSQAQRAISSFGKATSAVSAVLGVGFGAAVAAAAKSGIAIDSMLETTQLQFETLMGSADEAQKHVADLFEIAKKTPFETEPIIAASKALRTFGGDALDTKDRLIAVGDAAAATGGPIDDLAFWVGRLYSNLQGGQPFGEAAMRLQELAVLSPQARQEMEALQKSGASAEEVFAVFEESLGRFGGAMERQAETLPGLVATLTDSIKLGLGDAFQPVFEGLKTGLKEAISILEDPATTEGIASFAAQLGQITAAVVPFVVEHGPALLKLLGSLVVLLGTLSVAAKVAAVALKLAAAWASVTAAVAEGSTVLAAIVGVLGGPVTLVVAGVAAAVALLATAWASNWGGIREKTAAAWEFISGKVAEGVAAIRRFIEPGLEAIRAFWDKHGAGILNTVTHLWEAIKRLFQFGWENIVNTFKIFQALFSGDWEELGRLLRERFENTLDAISDIMWNLWDAVGPALIDLAVRIVKWWNGIDWRELGRKALEGLKEGLAEGGRAGGDDPLQLAGLMTGGAASSGYEAGQRARKAFLKGWQAEGVSADEIFSPEAAAEQQRLADAAASVAQEAASADRVLGQYAQDINAVARSSDRAGGDIRVLDLYLAQTRDHLKLGADRAQHFAAGIDALTAAAARNKAELDAAALAAQNYATAFGGVQADYVTELPQADKPLVAPEQDVTIRTRVSGPTAEQAALAARYTEELQRLREAYAELTGGIGTFGMEQDKVNEKIAAVAGEMAYYQGLIDGLPPTVDNVSTAHQGLKVNVDAARQALYDQLIQVGAAPELVTAYAAAVGIMSDEQAEAALIAARLKLEIEALALKMSENPNFSLDEAMAELDALILKLEGGVEPAATALATDVPLALAPMSEEMSTQATAAGEAVPTNIATGITDTLDEATTAATDAADAIVQAVRDAHGIESPSSVFAEIGGQDIAGFVAGVEDAQGDAVSAMERVGQAVVDAWDETIEAADGIGAAIIDGVIAGLEANRGSLVEKMKEIAREAYEAAMAELQIKSPSKVFMRIGEAIIAGVVAGLDKTKDTLYGKLADIANTLYGIGSGVFGIQADALEEQVNDSTDRLTAALNGLRSAFGDTPIDNLLDMDPETRAYFLRTLRGASAAGNMLVRQQLEEAIRLADERNALEDEYIRQQEELARLEEQRTRLDFLQQQVDLLDLIRENNLSTDILGGLTLGLDANMGDVIAAMTEAMRQLVERASDELGIASPSAVFRAIGENVMNGLAQGLARTREVERRLREGMQRMRGLGVADARGLEAQMQAAVSRQLQVSVSGINPAQNIYIYGGLNASLAAQQSPEDMLRALYWQAQ